MLLIQLALPVNLAVRKKSLVALVFLEYVEQGIVQEPVVRMVNGETTAVVVR